MIIIVRSCRISSPVGFLTVPSLSSVPLFKVVVPWSSAGIAALIACSGSMSIPGLNSEVKARSSRKARSLSGMMAVSGC